MKIYRITHGEIDSFEIRTYHKTLESAKNTMIADAKEERKCGVKYWEYTWTRVESLEIDGKHNEDDWKIEIKCKDLIDEFPPLKRDRDGNYEDEEEYHAEDGHY